MENIRNFSFVAHVDHGKSTLADRLLEMLGNVSKQGIEDKQQFLDNLQVERERGITVKAQTASMVYTDEDGNEYLLNMIDTPGHVDFSYEVGRSLRACQGVALLIDSTQGVQAQTIAHHRSAIAADLAIVWVLTKTDLPLSNAEQVKDQLELMFDAERDDIISLSAKTGEGVDKLLPALVHQIPSPARECASYEDGKVRALLFDSWYEDYRGVVCLLQVLSGRIATGDKLYMQSAEISVPAQEVGLLGPQQLPLQALRAGQVGYWISGLRDTRDASIGETVTSHNSSVPLLVPVAKAKPMVFASLFPADGVGFEDLQKAINRLLLNDASVTIAREMVSALGAGFRCGFLGLLHMDVFKQRLSDEQGVDVIVTAPNVPYQVRMKKNPKETIVIERPVDLPAKQDILEVLEPIASASVVAPGDYFGALTTLFSSKRAEQTEMSWMDENMLMLSYTMPFNEVVTNLHDEIKALTAGYGTLDYQSTGYRAANITRVDIRLNGETVDALAFLCHQDEAYSRGRDVVERLKVTVRRQQFEVVLQAVVGNKPIARARIAPFRKNVLVKGGKTMGTGDVTRKKKLLENQKRGKKRLKSVGKVALSQEAFLSVIQK